MNHVRSFLGSLTRTGQGWPELSAIATTALDAVGSAEWPDGHQVLSLSAWRWLVQPATFYARPFVRYELAVELKRHAPTCFRITHGSQRSGLCMSFDCATSTTQSLDSLELMHTLSEVRLRYGPMVLLPLAR